MATTISNPGTQKHTSDLTHSSKLEDQAAVAALYVTRSQREDKDGDRFLEGGKLSSAGAAASLKYAQPQDLPSFPSSGLKKNDSAAGAAASLGWANQKSFEHWKPDGTSSSASKAAMLAKDYKAPALWQSEPSAHGAKAAVLAHRDGGKVDIWTPEQSAWGNSAATQAMKVGKNNALSPRIDYGYTDLGRQGSMMAATGAMSMSTRKRADSTPVPKAATYPDEANAAVNALSAATHANTSSRTAYSSDAGAVPYTNMAREMFTSNPPAAPERLDASEKSRQDTLHASAVAMAKRMYTMQQKQIDAASKAQSASAATSAHGRRRSNSDSDDEIVPMRFNNLQEAAQRLAQERLAKLHDEHAQAREYRNYYGGNTASKPKSRLSLRGRPQRRASSDGELEDDRVQSQKIRAQMSSLFNSNLSQVDNKKRQADRDALMAAAQRNVTARLSGMDEKVFKDTGKVGPSMLNEWEVKAHAAAQKDSDKRMENYGKVNIGGGQFINQSAVDLVARKNVQPVLDEINEKAEQERVRQAELKLEEEAKKREAEAKKQREQEVKDVNKKLKAQDKEEERARKAEEKKDKDMKKQQDKEAKRLEKETKRKSAGPGPIATTGTVAEEDVASPSTTEAAPDATTTESRTADGFQASDNFRTSMEYQQSERLEAVIRDGAASGDPPKSPKKNWFKRFSTRRKSKTSNGEGDKAFVGGNALTGAGSTTSIQNSAAVNEHSSSTAGNVVEENRGRRAERASSVVSSLSSISASGRRDEPESEEEFEEARDNFDEGLAPPPTFPAEKSSSPSRASKFTEVV